jgi:hypothetical protein
VDHAVPVRVVGRVGDRGRDPDRFLDAELRFPIQLARSVSPAMNGMT